MKVAVFDTNRYDQEALQDANQSFQHELVFFESRLTSQTAKLSQGFPCVCCFVNDQLNEETLEILKSCGVRLIALRSAGYNHVDLIAAEKMNMKVVRVPEYSPYAVAEHTLALILTLNRRIHRSFNRVRELNFSLDGLVGFDLHGKTVGVIGTGRIGATFARLIHGFGVRILAFDPQPSERLIQDFKLSYVSLDTLMSQSDIISLHVPLNHQTYHMINEESFNKMKPNAMLVNTSRGGLIESQSLIDALKMKKIGSAALDVYEEEEGIFFEDLSESGLHDDLLARLLTFPNVLITSHQAFLTKEALNNIATVTLQNITKFETGLTLENEVKHELNS